MSLFQKWIESQRLSFPCPVCPSESPPVFAEHFEDHCVLKHALLPHRQCPWCLGHATLPDAASLEEHMASSCFERFMRDLPRPATTVPAAPTLCDLEPLSHHSAAQPAYPIAPLPLPPASGLTYQSDALNVALACLRLFLAGDADWTHVMVREAVFPAFCAGMKGLRMLPFYCSCRGSGAYHRHLILTGRGVRHVFRKLRCPSKSASVKRLPLLTPGDLVRALDCVSREKCPCDFSFRPKVAAAGERQPAKSHFNLGLSLPRSHALLLAFHWPGGVAQHWHDRFGSLDAASLSRVAFQQGGLWVARMRDVPGFGGEWVLPVARHLRPCGTRKTEYFVHLPGGGRFYFEEGEEEEEDWLERQARGGNSVGHLVGETVYYPTGSQQRGVGALKPFLEAFGRAEEACERARRDLERANESGRRWKASHASLKRKAARSEKDLQALQRKHILYLEKENDALRMENEDFRRKKAPDLEEEEEE